MKTLMKPICCGILAATAMPFVSQTALAQALEEIVVTAERIERDLQTTPVSVLQVTGEEMAELGVENIQELSNFLPNVSVGASASSTGSSEQQFTIRGVSQIRTGISGDRSVGFYIDDQFFPRTTGSTMRALDIANVEVLRGPQGTLFGRNNTGGAIRFTTNKPTDEFSGSVRLGLGDFNRRNIFGSINLPLGDMFAFRGSLASYEKDGYVEGTATSETLGNIDDLSFRGILRFKPTDNFTADLAYTDIDSEENGFPMIHEGSINPWDLDVLACQVANPTGCPRGSNPASDFVQFPGGAWVGVPLPAPPGFNDSTVATKDRYTYVGGDDQFHKVDEKILNLQLNWDISEKVSLRSITASLEIDTDRFADQDQSPLPILTSSAQTEHESWSQEFQLLGKGLLDGFMDVRTGAFLFHEENHSQSRNTGWGGITPQFPWTIIQPPPDSARFELDPGEFVPWTAPGFAPGAPDVGVCPRWYPFAGDPLNPTPVEGSTELMGCIDTANMGPTSSEDGRGSTADSWAIYLDGTFYLGEKLSLTAGVRYSEDEKTWVIDNYSTRFTGFIGEKEDSWDAIDWRGVVQYQWNEDVMTYLSVSKAYKSGGFSDGRIFGFGGFFQATETRHPLTGEPVDSPFIPYDPEEVINYELGIRSEWFNNRIRANITYFNMDYKDKQTQIFILPSQTIPNTEFANSFGGGPLLLNASKVTIEGVEAEFLFAATQNLTLSAMIGYLDGGYDALPEGVNNLEQSLTLDTPLERAPEWSYTLGARYDWQLFSGNASFQITYAYTDEQYSGSDKTVQFFIEETELTNARLSYRDGNGRWNAGLYVNNLTDEETNFGGFCISCFNSGRRSFNTAFVGADLVMPGPPREIGVDFSFNF